ncbi:hypothetical protein [Neobacillus vireti]|uniref:hypothetical protein n=1 Tax=Neobacillus vireti TaxID=220686 RepID=UPI002FFE865A
MRNPKLNSIPKNERLRAIEVFFWESFPYKGLLKPETTKLFLEEIATNFIDYDKQYVDNLHSSINICCEFYYLHHRKVFLTVQEKVMSMWFHGASRNKIKEILGIERQEIDGYIDIYGVNENSPELVPKLQNGIHEHLHEFNKFVSHFLYKAHHEGIEFGLEYNRFLKHFK